METISNELRLLRQKLDENPFQKKNDGFIGIHLVYIQGGDRIVFRVFDPDDRVLEEKVSWMIPPPNSNFTADKHASSSVNSDIYEIWPLSRNSPMAAPLENLEDRNIIEFQARMCFGFVPKAFLSVDSHDCIDSLQVTAPDASVYRFLRSALQSLWSSLQV